MGSGGGGVATQVANAGIADQFAPYVEGVLADVKAKYDADRLAGPDSVIAGLTQEQQDALSEGKSIAQDAIAGTGIYDMTAAREADLKGILGSGMGQSSFGGNLGSARSQAATQKALGDVSANYLQQQQQNVLAGGKLMGDVGQSLQQQKQKMLDAPHLGASRYFGYLTGAPQQKVQTTTGGGK